MENSSFSQRVPIKSLTYASMKRFAFLIVLCLIHFSCIQGYDDIQSSNKPSGLKDCSEFKSETITPGDALTHLSQVMGSINQTTKTGLSSIMEDDLFAIGVDELFFETKANDLLPIPDTLLYGVNFKDGGFALLAGNININSYVLCITEKGKIDVEEMKSGMDFLIETSETKSSIENNSQEIEEDEFSSAGKKYLYSLLISSAVLDYFDDHSLREDLTTKDSGGSTQYGPLLTTKWKQKTPFNLYTPNNYDAGCVVIAVAQIMAYYGKPNTFKLADDWVSWPSLRTVYPYSNPTNAGNTFAQTQAGLLSKVLGNSNNCDVDYTATGSASNSTKAKHALENFGYHVTRRIGFGSIDKNKTDEYIESSRPVYMEGTRSGGHGHAWVIDGMVGDYYHINWGWNGDCDGYYAKGTFNTSNRHSYDTTFDSGTAYTTGRNYYHYFRILLCYY